MTTTDPKDVVRRGYDALSHHYRGDDTPEGRYQPWIAELRRRIQANGTVLDLGCGCGVPLARSLANTGYAVTGVDLSDVQIRRARQLVPSATFLWADATTVDFPTASFDAVVCLYALIHMPLDEQPPLLARIATWLRPGGWFLATTGHRAWTGTQDNWLGGAATMWWSHADTTTYRSWITHTGLIIQTEDFIPEGTSGHTLFLARRPSTTTHNTRRDYPSRHLHNSEYATVDYARLPASSPLVSCNMPTYNPPRVRRAGDRQLPAPRLLPQGADRRRRRRRSRPPTTSGGTRALIEDLTEVIGSDLDRCLADVSR